MPSRTFHHGVIAGLPVALGYLPITFALGVTLRGVGLTLLDATAMSAFVFAGSSQFVAAGMWGAGQSVAAIVAATLLVNARHLLMGAALGPALSGLKPWTVAGLAHGLLTALGELPDQLHGLKLGVDDYIPKPFDGRAPEGDLAPIPERISGRPDHHQ